MIAPPSLRSAWLFGGLHAVVIGEGPQCRPDLQQVAREATAVAVARAFAGVAAQDRLELAAHPAAPDAQDLGGFGDRQQSRQGVQISG